MFPTIDPSEVGVTGLLWLLFSYGYVLFTASNLISGGSDLLLLVPSLAGLVGGVVLPLLGAVPDAAIMLFSGMGDKETAQNTLSVGVGALAGSTIMLLTVPWALSIFAGRVNLNRVSRKPNYKGSSKLTKGLSCQHQLENTGVVVTKEVQFDGTIMLLTTIPYFLIQIPAMFLHGPSDKIAKGEKYWALLGLIACIAGFVKYLIYHIHVSMQDHEKFKRMEVVKDLLKKGNLSLSGAFVNIIQTYERESVSNGGYSSIGDASEEMVGGGDYPDAHTKEYLEGVLKGTFHKYDKDRNSSLEKSEVKMFLRDFHEQVTDSEIDVLFQKYDTDGNGSLNFHEFVGACYSIIKHADRHHHDSPNDGTERVEYSIAHNMIDQMEDEGGDEEDEEIPEDISNLPPEEQQYAIKKKACVMLFIGTALVLIFSDPMVDVMQALAFKMDISPFYISFVLAPLASNASEVIASQYYAAKKTEKTISVAFSALQGAASMNNTFCLSIFMGLIYFRGLAWQYTAETVAICFTQLCLYWFTRDSVLTPKSGLVILALFPLSIALVASLKAMGFD